MKLAYQLELFPLTRIERHRDFDDAGNVETWRFIYGEMVRVLPEPVVVVREIVHPLLCGSDS